MMLASVAALNCNARGVGWTATALGGVRLASIMGSLLHGRGGVSSDY
jgi:hypothetical protein